MMLSAFIIAIALGQAQVPIQPSAQVPPRDRQTDDKMADEIVVKGYRNKPDVQTKTSPIYAGSSAARRQQYSMSERMAKCAARSRLANTSYLSAVVDGEFNSAAQLYAQDHLYRIYVTCGESPSFLSLNSPPASAGAVGNGDFTAILPGSTDGAPLGHSIYDRGAFTIQAMKLYAPDLSLTAEQTSDPAVQARFDAREVPRNRFRLPADYKYFEIAVCIVRVAPRLSVRLAMSDGSAGIGDLQWALIDRARVCVGNAREVRIDATEFRIYIADAVYRWVVAANGVKSLIPPKVK